MDQYIVCHSISSQDKQSLCSLNHVKTLTLLPGRRLNQLLCRRDKHLFVCDTPITFGHIYSMLNILIIKLYKVEAVVEISVDF